VFAGGGGGHASCCRAGRKLTDQTPCPQKGKSMF
jgi:hypothetical protein